MAGTGVMLVVFAPISLMFSVVTTSYHFMKILHVVVFAIAGLFGVKILGEGLAGMQAPEEDAPPPPTHGKSHAVLYSWLLLYCLVGAQLAWTLKPFLGTPYLPATPPFRLDKGNIFVSTLESFRGINPAFEREIGYRREEVIGHTPTELGILDPAVRGRAIAQLQDRQRICGFEAPYRIESGAVRIGLFAVEKGCIDGQPVLFTAVIDITERKQVQAEERQIALAYEPASVPLPVCADPARIQQCLGNLLQNSLQFTPAGGAITVSCRREGDTALLAIRDTGRGIEPDRLPEIFHPFRQVDRDDSIGGLGLGLSVVRGIIELHGGHIRADSPGPGQGSTFTITLPVMSTGE